MCEKQTLSRFLLFFSPFLSFFNPSLSRFPEGSGKFLRSGFADVLNPNGLFQSRRIQQLLSVDVFWVFAWKRLSGSPVVAGRNPAFQP